MDKLQIIKTPAESLIRGRKEKEKIMSTKGDTIKINVSVEHDMADELEKRADDMYLLTDEYCGLVISNWITSGQLLPA